ncbi:RNA polymerase sigma factor [Clostridium tyrobutyricum]|uniref:RNA polymerase sigma factor n=1 Tax=Clostridium tyrobutyricum TaxID=1519 RepID=UPI00058029F8|nr:sigma factor-like helix-turn-helix DNA-binding protein [Clostridium tyrobutyricum]
MKGNEIIALAEKYLKSVPEIKRRTALMDEDLKNGDYNMYTFKEIKESRDRLYIKLTKIIKAISTLKEENQKIICYRYFAELTYKAIALRVGISSSTVRRRVEFSLLSIGRVLFGMEDEFWKEIDRIQK